MSPQAEKAAYFRELHYSGKILMLPNVWDVASARIVEQAGARAIATSSAGVAFALGYPDGEQIPCSEMVEAVGRMARAVEVPLTADFEAGYGESVEAVAENVKAVIAAGAVGINFEDSKGHEAGELEDLELHLEKIRSIREVAASLGIPLVLNARTDVFLCEIGDPATRLDHAVIRANQYRKAGADCLFVPGVIDAPTIAGLTRQIDGPVNILAGPGAPSVPELEKMGVARVSLGSKPMCAAMGLLKRIAHELLGQGTYRSLEDRVSSAEMNKRVQK